MSLGDNKEDNEAMESFAKDIGAETCSLPYSLGFKHGWQSALTWERHRPSKEQKVIPRQHQK